jgi:starch-binding outer membrane protein, SusD/RagB family
MKIRVIYLIFVLAFSTACNDLNLNPLSEGSSENWYSNETEINMAVNDLYRDVFWPVEDDEWTDDRMYRERLQPITNATINGQWGPVNNIWSNSYKVIARANTILLNLDKVKGTIPQATFDKFEGNALFVRAAQYAKLISLYGDVVYYTGILELEESFTLSKTSKATILKAIYTDYDAAAAKLPLSYGSSVNKLATKGAALAMKARIALYMGEHAVARDAAKACIDLGAYELHSGFSALFLTKTKNPKELIFGIPRSRALNVTYDVRDYLPRNVGGWGAAMAPTWDLFNSFLCSDGLTIDKSPLYNPREPFKNRDPRCTATIVEFQTRHLNFMYQPHPDSIRVMNFNTGNMQSNTDTRSVAAFASFNGLMLKKGVDEDWLPNYRAENDKFIMRYADVLLMFAEAKIELGEIDSQALEAFNRVRARAYGVAHTATNAYPAVTAASKEEMRKLIRIERRMEFAFEGLRYMDIIRWRIAETVLNRSVYGMLDVADLRAKVIQPGLWFFPGTPVIDENGCPIMEPMYTAGLIKRLSIRQFDATKQYLWPLPTKEILINTNLVQNPGY